jgi:hypothetical protein
MSGERMRIQGRARRSPDAGIVLADARAVLGF